MKTVSDLRYDRSRYKGMIKRAEDTIPKLRSKAFTCDQEEGMHRFAGRAYEARAARDKAKRARDTINRLHTKIRDCEVRVRILNDDITRLDAEAKAKRKARKEGTHA